MILVRMVFQTQWGKSQEVAEEFKQSMEWMRSITGHTGRVRILTDLSGAFNRVVQEIEYESLAEAERARAALFSSSEFQQRQMDSPLPLESGYTEFFTIEATSDGQ
jgi:hypothetical protein